MDNHGYCLRTLKNVLINELIDYELFREIGLRVIGYTGTSEKETIHINLFIKLLNHVEMYIKLYKLMFRPLGLKQS